MSDPDAGEKRSNACGRHPGVVGEKTGKISAAVTDLNRLEGQDRRSFPLARAGIIACQPYGQNLGYDHEGQGQGDK